MAAATATGLVWLAFRWWGLAAASATFIFYLACPTVLAWSSNHLDEVWTFFLVAVLWAATKVVDRGGFRWGLALGLILSAGYLTKEALMLLTPLPFLALLSARKGPAWKPVISGYCIGLGVPVFAWTSFVVAHGGTVSWGLIGPIAAGTATAVLDGSVSWGRLSDVAVYLRNAGLGVFLLAVSAVASPVLALRGSTADRVVMWALVLLSPFLVYTMVIPLRPGQLIPLVMLSALILGRLTTRVAERIACGRPGVTTALSLVAALATTIPDHQAIRHHLNGTRIASILRSEAPGTHNMLFSADKLVDAVRAASLDETAPLLVYDTELNCYSCSVAYFQSKGERRYLPFPFYIATADNLHLSAWLPQADDLRRVDYIRPQFEPTHRRHRLWLLDLVTLQRYATEQGALHLAVLEPGNSALMALMERSGFRLVSSGRGYRLYAMDGQVRHAAKPVIEGAEAYCGAIRHMSEDDFFAYRTRLRFIGSQFENLFVACRG